MRIVRRAVASRHALPNHAYPYPIIDDSKRHHDEEQSPNKMLDLDGIISLSDNHTHLNQALIDVAKSKKEDLSVKNHDLPYQDCQDRELVTESSNALKRKLETEGGCRNTKAAMLSKICKDEGFMRSKLESSKRHLLESYQVEDKKRRLIKILDIKDLPKQVSCGSRRGYKIHY
ncbi:hypothetical protein L484_006862 [Morus notabilis]|uniref:Uncharacterized protein n=1 Tax=Morus notabilis TaxID=981085 RepID=W9RL03_9ROSA|nr:hypothetical protein L484_006862 [Morus notabilis]